MRVSSSVIASTLSLSHSPSPSLSVRFNVHSQSHSHFPFVQSSGCPPSPPLPLSLSGIPLLPLRVTLEGSSTSASASASASALPLLLFSALLAWPAFPLTLLHPLPSPSPSLSAFLLLFLLLSYLALALASASHLVIICIEKCQSQRAAQPPHDNRSDFPPTPSCIPSSTRLCSALLCCCPSVLFASVCCTSVYQQSRFDVALRAAFPSSSLPFFLALFLQFLTAQLVRERERETEREEGSEAVGHAGAAAAYRGCQARRADQRRLMDRQTVQHTNSPSFTPPPPWHIKHIF